MATWILYLLVASSSAAAAESSTQQRGEHIAVWQSMASAVHLHATLSTQVVGMS
jgi:hypothetical protein